MNSQFTLRLSCIANTLHAGLSPSLQQIHQTLALLTNYSPSQKVIVHLLALIINNRMDQLAQPYNQQQQRQQKLDNIAELLNCLTPLLQTQIPLRHLLTRQFAHFNSYCEQANNKEIKQLALHSQGLYPPNDINGNGSVFSQYSKEKLPFQGNPNWLITRYALYHWYKLNKDTLDQAVRHIYSFLLCQDGFRVGNSAIGRLWSLLYCYYTQNILKQSFQESRLPKQKFLTWCQRSVQSYRTEIIFVEGYIPQQLKIIYYLMCELLQELSLKGSVGLATIYNTYLNNHNQNNELQLLTHTLFLKLAESRMDNTAATTVRDYMRARLSSQRINGQASFLPIYFKFDEILPRIISSEIDTEQISLQQNQKKQIATAFLARGRINAKWLEYLSNQQFIQLFTSKQWGEGIYTGRTLRLISENRQHFLLRLRQLAHQSEQLITKSQLNLFQDVWNSYQLCITGKYDLSLLQQTLHLKQQHLRKSYRFLLLPRVCPNAVFKLLMCYSRLFMNAREQIKAGAPIKKLLQEFQQNELPSLLPVIDQNQRTQFWKQFIDVIKAEPQFVKDILHAAEPSTNL